MAGLQRVKFQYFLPGGIKAHNENFCHGVAVNVQFGCR
jgi:hypothetical protein